MFSLDAASTTVFDLRARNGAYAGLVTLHANGFWKVYFNSDATRGSARKFPTLNDALAYIADRRVKKGWVV